MLILLALLSVFAYALNDVLFSKLAREVDSLSATTCRALSLSITMLPLLFFVDSYENIGKYQILLFFISSSLTALAVYSFTRSMTLLPANISAATRVSTTVASMSLISIFFLDQEVDWNVGVGFFIVAFSSVLLILFNSDTSKPENYNLKKGVVYSVASGFLLSVSIALLSLISSTVDPLLTAYLWEAGIGACLLVVVLLKRRLNETIFNPIAIKITFASFPTVVGTALMLYVLSSGAVLEYGVIMTTNVLFVTLIASFAMNERVNKKTLTSAVGVVLGLALVKAI